MHEAPLESDLGDDPFDAFARWFAEARAAHAPMPEAMALATATPAGRPSLRMVLLKEHGPRGFVFYTNYGSRKATELDANAHAALLFHWQPLGRQVRVEGTAERTSPGESAAYFRTRPRASRLAAWASRQSALLADREQLERAYAAAARRFGDGEVPAPAHWGGYRVLPRRFEFWRHGEHRLHDRVRFDRDGDGWRRTRLAP